ncbi:hypothetical protein AAW14_06650 [Streptomyces hygroscopicus]|nr:hypothetical protein [Streptomyces hygroscopicus]
MPDDLITLERAAEQARTALAGLDGAAYTAQWERWRDAAGVFQAAVTAHAEATGQSRVEVEMAVKKTVRWPEPETAEA